MSDSNLQKPTMEDLRPDAFFDLKGVQHARLFEGVTFAWEAISKLPQYIAEFFDQIRSNALSKGELEVLDLRQKQHIEGTQRVVAPPGYELPNDLWIDGELIIEEGVKIGPFCRISGKNYLATGAVLESHIVIEGNSIIGRGCQLKPFTYLRGNVVLGEQCEVRAEIKNAILLDAADNSAGSKIGTSIAHGLYIGDAIVGRGVNLGAGTVLANIRLDWQQVHPLGRLREVFDKLESPVKLQLVGYKHCGVIGDWVTVGCESIVGPAVMIGPRCRVFPHSIVTGYVPPNHEWRGQGQVKQILADRGIGTYEGRI